ncbi:hypothetical protein D7Z26_08930 [Cohnella endophytica]|uniref:Uncharacterized protein n=1 Tax=Cohnella endophytica TaxID=2419778 RepID=A0A494XXL3_9BACL|nr:hypothetical protein [Cohnella endophytica]RKP55317.1 hypothetical protein D7Z26_08930 [Cohnella endophytica]
MKYIAVTNGNLELECSSCGMKHIVLKGNFAEASFGYELSPKVLCSCGDDAAARVDGKAKRSGFLILFFLFLPLLLLLSQIIRALLGSIS